jgi:arsenite-transporting ATPase
MAAAAQQWVADVSTVSSPTLLDLSGEQWLSLIGPVAGELRCFEAVPVALGLWEGVQPRLEGWWRLLGLARREAHLIPPLPGVEPLLQCLYLAEQLDALATTGQRVTVLLPSPASAMALLELARTGPDLVEGLLDPLVRWWEQTRQSLGALPKLAGLVLPSGSELRLEPHWRQRLERMALLLTSQDRYELTLGLEAGDPEARLVSHRLSRAALRGAHPTRLLLHGRAAPAAREVLAALPVAPVLASAQDVEDLSLSDLVAFLARANGAPSGMCLDQAAGTLSLPMLGLHKDQLQVRQLGARIVLLSGGHRRLVALPAPFDRQTCVGAKLEGGRLELRFQAEEKGEAPLA